MGNAKSAITRRGVFAHYTWVCPICELSGYTSQSHRIARSYGIKHLHKVHGELVLEPMIVESGDRRKSRNIPPKPPQKGNGLQSLKKSRECFERDFDGRHVFCRKTCAIRQECAKACGYTIRHCGDVERRGA